MYTVTKYPHGTFSWAECVSPDSAQGKAFYAKLMGWDANDIPMGDGLFYTMFKHDDHTVAALNPPQSPDEPSRWNSYITVDNVDALVDKVKALGGTVIAEPFDVFEEGRMMVIQDPCGAFVSFWQAKNHIGANLVNTPGAMTWNELATKDTQKARDFFEKLLGWQYQKMDGTDDYYLILNKGRMNGGIIGMNEEWGDMPPHWMVYFSVKDIDDSIAKVQANGGKIMVPTVDVPNLGRFIVISDPQGAICSLIQLEKPDTWSN